MSGNEPKTSIPEGYDMKKIVGQLIYELWRSDKLDKQAVQRIRYAGQP